MNHRGWLIGWIWINLKIVPAYWNYYAKIFINQLVYVRVSHRGPELILGYIVIFSHISNIISYVISISVRLRDLISWLV